MKSAKHRILTVLQIKEPLIFYLIRLCVCVGGEGVCEVMGFVDLHSLVMFGIHTSKHKCVV